MKTRPVVPLLAITVVMVAGLLGSPSAAQQRSMAQETATIGTNASSPTATDSDDRPVGHRETSARRTGNLRFPTATLARHWSERKGTIDRDLAIQRVKRIPLQAMERTGRPRLFEDGPFPAMADGLLIEYSLSATEGRRGPRRLEITEVGTSNVFQVPVEGPSDVDPPCEACTYEVIVPFENAPAADHALQLTLVSYDQGWHHSEPADLVWSAECDADPVTPHPYCVDPDWVTVEGHLTYWRREVQAREDSEGIQLPGSIHPRHPQYRYTKNVEFSRPASYTLVEATDACGGVTTNFSDGNGDYRLYFKTFCPDRAITLRAYSYGPPVPGRDVALGLHTVAQPAKVLGDLRVAPSDYTVFSDIIGTFTPEADAPGGGPIQIDKHFAINEPGDLRTAGLFSRTGEMARALGIMESIRIAQAYQAELIDVSKLDRINVVLTDLPLEGNDNTAFFLGGDSKLIYLPPWAEFSPFPAWHEMFHYFDEQTLGNENYGRWGEPMATVRAAMLAEDPHMALSISNAAESVDYNWNWVENAAGPTAPPAVNQGQTPWSIGWKWRIGWDLADGTGSEPVQVNGSTSYDGWDGWLGDSSDPNNSKLHRVVLDYLPQQDSWIVNGMYEDRGQSGPDLVDLLDGMVCIYGMSEAHIGVLLDDVMNYNYDFNPSC